MKNLYDILKIKKNTSLKGIKKSYHRLAVEHHPDKNAGQESQEFLDINTAYMILKDRCKRTEYDKTGKFDTQVVDIRRLALQSLAGLFLGIVKNPSWNFRNDNLFIAMERHILMETQKITSKEKAILLLIERLEIVNDRITGKDFMFNEMIQSDLNLQKLTQANIEREKNILEEAKSIIKDYKYKVDKTEFISFMSNGMSSTTSTTGY